VEFNKKISRGDIVYCLWSVTIMIFLLISVYCFDIEYISSIRDYKYGTVISMLVLGEFMVLVHKFFRRK
jgi:hypothetical protein